MARRRNIYDASYQTPLADFLDQLPDYFLRYEQLKQAEADRTDQRAFRDKQYNNALEQQRKDNLYRQQQAKYKKTSDAYNRQFKTIDSMDLSSDIKAKMLSDLNSRPEYAILGIDNTRANNYEAQMKKLKDDYNAYSAEYIDIEDLSDTDEFSNYARIETLRDSMNKDRLKYSGTTWEKRYNEITTELSKKISDLSNKAGKYKGDNFLNNADKQKMSGINSSLTNARNKKAEAEVELLAYISSTYPVKFDKDGKPKERTRAEQIDMNADVDIQQYQAKIKAHDNQLNSFNNQLIEIQEKPEYRYPPIATSADIIEMNNIAQEQTRWVTEEATDLWKLFPDERLRLLSDEPVSSEEFEQIKSKYSDFKADQEETGRLSKAFTAKMLGEDIDEDDDIPPMWLDPATEPVVPKVEEKDVFADFSEEQQLRAQYLIDRGMTNEQVFAQLESEKPPTPKTEPKPTDISPVLEPLTARGDVEKETVIEKKEKEAKGAQLFPKVSPPVSLKELKDGNISDSKGKPVSFENANEFNKQLDSMYKEVQSINKSLRQGGFSREQRELENTRAKSILENLVKALSVKDIKATAVKDKNIKAVASNFLKNRKYKSPQDLQEKMLTLLK